MTKAEFCRNEINWNALGGGIPDEFVLTDRVDYEFARDFVASHGLAGRVNAILLSPAFEKSASGTRDTSHCMVDPQELAQWMLGDNVPARLSLQIHKLIWDPAAKGV